MNIAPGSKCCFNGTLGEWVPLHKVLGYSSVAGCVAYLEGLMLNTNASTTLVGLIANALKKVPGLGSGLTLGLGAQAGLAAENCRQPVCLPAGWKPNYENPASGW